MINEMSRAIIYKTLQLWYNELIITWGCFMTKWDYIIALTGLFLIPGLFYAWMVYKFFGWINRLLDKDIPNRIGFGVFCLFSLTVIGVLLNRG